MPILSNATLLPSDYRTRAGNPRNHHGAVANEAAMLALDAVVDDRCRRADLGGAEFVLAALPATTASNWHMEAGEVLAALSGVNGGLTASNSAGLPLRLDGVARSLTPYRATTGSLLVRGEPGAVLTKTSGTIALHAEPQALESHAATGGTTTTIVVAGAGWTVNEHAGRVATINNAGGYRMNRWVVSNTADTLTLRHALDGAAVVSNTVTIYEPIDRVELGGFSLLGAGLGGAGIVLRFVREVVLLPDLIVDNHVGNGITLDTCLRVRAYSPTVRASQFGIFAYNCDDCVIVAPTCEDATADYNIQLKDCRDSTVVAPTCAGGQDGIDIKSSGLNPTYNVKVIGANVEGCATVGVYAHALVNEGATFKAVNYSILGASSKGCGTGFLVSEGAAGLFQNFVASSIQAEGSTGVGASLDADGVEVNGLQVLRSGSDNIEIKAARVVLRDVVAADRTTVGPSVVFEADAQGCLIDGLRLIRTASGSGTYGVQFVAGSATNLVRAPLVEDAAGAWSSFAAVSGTDNRIVGDVPNWVAPGLDATDVEGVVRWARPPERNPTVAVTALTTLSCGTMDRGGLAYDGSVVHLQPTGGHVVKITNFAFRGPGFRLRLYNDNDTHTTPIRLEETGIAYEDGSVNGSSQPQKDLLPRRTAELLVIRFGATPLVRWIG